MEALLTCLCAHLGRVCRDRGRRSLCAALGLAIAMPAVAAADWIDGYDETRPPPSSQAELMSLCLAAPGNSEESCACGVDYAVHHLDGEELAILAFMAAEMQMLDADMDLFLSIIHRFRLDPERFHKAMAAINRVSAEASEICERPLLPPPGP